MAARSWRQCPRRSSFGRAAAGRVDQHQLDGSQLVVRGEADFAAFDLGDGGLCARASGSRIARSLGGSTGNRAKSMWLNLGTINKKWLSNEPVTDGGRSLSLRYWRAGS
jgi:hypothetical protein